MAIKETLLRIHEILEAGMTTGHDNDEYYIKTWYRNDPIGYDARELPFAVITPGNSHRVSQYVDEDTSIDPVTVHFFPDAISVQSKAQEVTDTLNGMADRASLLIREDPTLGVVDIYDAIPTGTTPHQPGFTGSGSTAHSIELQIEVKRRVPWDIP